MDSKEYYNKLFKESKHSGWNDAPGKKVILGAFLDLVKEQKNTIIDVGCGSGYFINEVKKNNPIVAYEQDYHAFDISNEAIVVAQKKYTGICFKQMDASCMEYKDEFFDSILSYGVIEHVREPLKALKEIRRILKPDGFFLIMVPSLDSYRSDRTDEGWYEDLDSNKQMQWNYSRKTWEGMFKDANLCLFDIKMSERYGALKPGVFFLGRRGV